MNKRASVLCAALALGLVYTGFLLNSISIPENADTRTTYVSVINGANMESAFKNGDNIYLRWF